MTIVPRAGPFSASSAFATTSWYQRGKSSLGEVRTLAITRSYLQASAASGRSSLDPLVDQVDALFARVRVVALLVEQRVAILVRGGLGSSEVRLRQRPLDAVLVDELGPFDE